MQTIPRCSACKSTVFTLAHNPNMVKTRINTGIKVLKCMVCGSYDEPEHINVYDGEADLARHIRGQKDIVYRYRELIKQWSQEWKIRIGK